MVWRYEAYSGTRSVFVKWLLALLFWWRRKAPPSPVTKFNAKVKHMTDIKLAWKDPTTREDGSAIDPVQELTGIEIFMRVSGAPDFTKLNTIAPGVQAFTVTDLPAGSYEFQAVAVDKQVPPKLSAVATANATIVVPPVVLAAPSAVSEFVAAVA